MSAEVNPTHSPPSSARRLVTAAAAAFCVYFCMYAFRKPFTAATFENETAFGFALKAVLVVSQLVGYMLSKFIGIKVISEMRREQRAWAIIGLILIAEAALVGFAYAPTPIKVLMMFLNGLPLGMVFGLVLGYLEGRRQTEALSAALCASFISSSGVVKSVGRWLIQDWHVDEYQMPMLTGLIFFVPLLVSVWVLQATPPPDETDRNLRRERSRMNGGQRRAFLAAYWPGLSLLVFVFISLTVIRTIRDDFGVEIWRDLGVTKMPSVFASAETVVAVLVTALNAFAIWIRSNLAALRATVGMMCGAFALVGASVALQWSGAASPFAFMVMCGVGLYVPYVAFHTTVFERLIAASNRPCNLGFLMYVADSLGYLGYAVVIIVQTAAGGSVTVLPFFLWSLVAASVGSIAALVAAMIYFERALAADQMAPARVGPPANLEELARAT